MGGEWDGQARKETKEEKAHSDKPVFSMQRGRIRLEGENDTVSL